MTYEKYVCNWKDYLYLDLIFSKRNDREELELFGENTRAQTILVMVGRSAGRHCFKKEVGIEDPDHRRY